jgi:hypothetical protein
MAAVEREPFASINLSERIHAPEIHSAVKMGCSYDVMLIVVWTELKARVARIRASNPVRPKLYRCYLVEPEVPLATFSRYQVFQGDTRSRAVSLLIQAVHG